MTRMQKRYGFRLNGRVAIWKDRFGKPGGRIKGIIPLKYRNSFQLLVSNGDILTSEYILYENLKALEGKDEI